MSDEHNEIYPEIERFDRFMQKANEEPLVEIPRIPPEASEEEVYKILVPLAAEALAIIAADVKQPASARVAAVKEINDRAFGKSTAKLEIEHTHNHIHKHLEKAREIRKKLYADDVIEGEIINDFSELEDKVDTEVHI
jgi:hypothetical protein